MAASKATLHAADAMAEVPGIINDMSKRFSAAAETASKDAANRLKEAARVIEKAFENPLEMTQDELNTFKEEVLGEITISDEKFVEDWNNKSAEEKA
jgi:nanoRNase/pAp phosphatase (c-di-AMP/oligoRNAs hydrolase)